MFEGMLTPALAPFSIALGIMLLIALTEAMGTVFGISPSGLFDQILPDVDVDADFEIEADADASAEPTGLLSSLLGWLCIGKVPVLVLLVAFLTAFGLSGIVLQSIAKSTVGFHLPSIVAAITALFVALPPTRWLAMGLAKAMPKEESEAVSTTTFVGKVATITRGIAKEGIPAEAKLRDVHGQMHYVLVEPDVADDEYPQGSEVLLTSQSSAIRFRAILSTNALMSKT
ncbi:MAG: YqiJ family protein [Pseudomonadota bacterium]